MRVMVTGASRGIGLAFAREAAAADAHVIAGARRASEGMREAADEVVEADVRHLPARPVDVLAHCAVFSPDTPLLSLDAGDLLQALEVNVVAAARLAEEVRERVILFGSLYAHGASGNAGYAISKGALNGLADDLARGGVRVHVIVPGLVSTQLTEALPGDVRRQLVDDCPLRRAGDAKEVARAGWFAATGGLGSRHLRVTGGLREAAG